MDQFPIELLTLLLAAFMAGGVDAVVGGGGLIQIPALFVAYPGESAATLFGTNKCASGCLVAEGRRPAADLDHAGAGGDLHAEKEGFRPASPARPCRKSRTILCSSARWSHRVLRWFFRPGHRKFFDLPVRAFLWFRFPARLGRRQGGQCRHQSGRLAYFVPNGYVLPVVAAIMAAANVSGSLASTWLALRHGSAFVRQVFLLVVGVLIVKFAWDTFVLL